jgi:ornithine cyclodeaminase
MLTNDLLILKGHEVLSLLEGRELEVIQTVRRAYEAHAVGDTSLPHSTFLRFRDDERNRIIALPAYLGDDFDIAGIKWVSSFPGNVKHGLDRASAVVILNSALTGRPEALIEGSIVSAKRTAASAALAAQVLQGGMQTDHVAFLGCGLINFEIARFLVAVHPEVARFSIYDLDAKRGNYFAAKCRKVFGDIKINIVDSVETLLSSTTLISMATTASQPHIFDISACAPGSTILHISLRDLSPQVMLSGDNVVDDVDHVCRAQTSIHLTEQLVGNRGFIRCSLATILNGTSPARPNGGTVTVFSPFGLGILDLALARMVRELAIEHSRGLLINSFLPVSWMEEEAVESGLTA